MRRTVAVLALSCIAAGGGPKDFGRSNQAVEALDVFVTREVVSIGALEGEAPYLFGGVAGAHQLSDGGIVVADCQVRELRFFDSTGRHLHTAGGVGEGPGEFRSIVDFFPYRGDSIAVYDLLQARLSVFSEAGEFGRSFRATALQGGARPEGALADGRFVFWLVLPNPEAPAGRRIRGESMLILMDPLGRAVDSIGPLPGTELVAGGRGVGGRVRFGRESRLSVSRAGAALSVGDGSGVLVFGPSFQDSSRVYSTHPAQSVTPEHRRRWEEAYENKIALGRGGRSLPAYADAYSDTLRVHSDLYLDRDGGVWLQDPASPWHYPLKYTRYVDGQPSLRVQLPPRFYPFDLHPDGILGVAYDEYLVPRVKRLELAQGDTLTAAPTPVDVGPPWGGTCGIGWYR